MPNNQQLSQQIEDALVARNPRGMAQVQPALIAGYCLRAAQVLQSCILFCNGAGSGHRIIP